MLFKSPTSTSCRTQSCIYNTSMVPFTYTLTKKTSEVQRTYTGLYIRERYKEVQQRRPIALILNRCYLII